MLLRRETSENIVEVKERADFKGVGKLGFP